MCSRPGIHSSASMNKQADITIRPATIADAPLIGWGLCEAVGKEIVDNLAVNTSTDTVEQFFTQLARRTDSQYSWQNALVAEIDGELAGIAVGYDGIRLHELRKAFFELATPMLKLDFSGVPDETDDSEFYLDTLAVKPEYRGQGVAQTLINATFKRATETGKPLGLLVDDDNHKAQNLYTKCGFQAVGRRPFAGIEMTNMQKFR